MPKGTCQAEVTFNSENFKPIALAVTWLKALVSQSVENSIIFLKKFVATHWKSF